MKNISLLLLVNLFSCINLQSQVLDSTFGIPSSFFNTNNPNYQVLGTTACDFENRNDRALTAIHLIDGKIILAGDSQNAEGSDFAIARLLTNGKYDETLGLNGQKRIDLGLQYDSCLAAVKYNSNYILMGGCVRFGTTNDYVSLLTKIDFDGNIDFTFGDSGKVILDLPSKREMITKILPLPDVAFKWSD
jgi:Domain of unknown function (DUF5122) beta-propeller